jgi:23S rRNA-/tRNA-specific pseudouridylate synthase
MFTNDVNSVADSKENEFYSLLEMDLFTGKKHQLRLMCSFALESPLIGDSKNWYNGAFDLFRRSFKYTAI